MRKLQVLAVVSVVLTVLLLHWNVSLATSVPYPFPSLPMPDFDINEVNPNPIIDYKATEISWSITYWTLTEPIDPYILYAISNVGLWVPCRENETIFLQQVEEHNGEWKIKYQESYYEIEALASESPRPIENRSVFSGYAVLHRISHTTEHAASSILLAGLWGGILIVWKKKA